MTEQKATPQAIPPGAYIQEELEARGWTQTDLAEILGRPVRLVNEIISGKRQITPETAQGLAAAFGTSVELWMNLESTYRLRLANRVDESVSRRSRLYARAPIREMQRRGWIKKPADIHELEEELKRFYRVTSLDESPVLSVAARRTANAEGLTPAQEAWCTRASHLASSIQVSGFDSSKLDDLETKLRALAAYSKEVRHLPEVFASYGIRFVVVEPLAGSKIDGAAFWLNEDSPAIAVSVRYDRIDAFWFTVMHEFSHIKHGDALSVDTEILEEEGGSTRAPADDEEERANAEACESLIRQAELESFIRRVSPLYSKARINQFAQVIQTHPGIIIGQLQHRGEVGYYAHRDMLVKIRALVTEAALTDGWGKPLDSRQ